MDLETSQRDERNEGRQEATCLRQGNHKSKLQVAERTYSQIMEMILEERDVSTSSKL